MPRESCLYKRPKGRFIEIREERVVLCENDHCAAALMSALACWTDWRLKQLDAEGLEDDEPWFYASKDQFRKDLTKLYSKASVQQSMERLIRMGLLRVQEANHIGGKNRYLFEYEKANELLKALPKKLDIEDGYGPWTDDESATKISHGSADSISHESRLGLDASATKISHGYIRKKRTNKKEQETKEPSSLSPQLLSDQREGAESSKDSFAKSSEKSSTNQSEHEDETTKHSTNLSLCDPNPLPPSPLADDLGLDGGVVGGSIDLGMVDAEGFLKRYRGFGLRGAKKPNAVERAAVMERWTPIPMEDLEAALSAWQADEWARQNGYPVRGFLKRLDSLVETGRNGAETRLERTETPRPTYETPPIRPSASNCDFVSEWIEAFPADPPIRGKVVQDAISQDGFVESFPTVLDKMKALRTSPDSDWANFPWLFRTKEGYNEPNWKRLIKGGFDFKVKAAKRADVYNPEAVAQRVMAKVREKYGWN